MKAQADGMVISGQGHLSQQPVSRDWEELDVCPVGDEGKQAVCTLLFQPATGISLLDTSTVILLGFP